MKGKLALSLLMLIGFNLHSQEVEMADNMRENGKIYVVLGVVLIILIGMIIYLISIDRKLTKLEKQIKNN